MKILLSVNLSKILGEKIKSRALRSSCALFASYLALRGIQRGKGWEVWVGLSSRIGREIYTRRMYPKVLKELTKLDVIECDHSYRVEEYCKGFRLNPLYLGDLAMLEIAAPKLEKRLGKAKQARIPKTPPHDWLRAVWRDSVTLAPSVAETLKNHTYDTEFQKKRYEVIVEDLKNDYFSEDKKTGRIFYAGNGLPEILRHDLLIDGCATVELDVSASQPLLAACLYPRDCSEKDQYLSLCRSGLFYENLRSWSGMEINRDKFKERCFQEVFYGTFRSHRAVWAAFKNSFPILAAAIVAEKVKSKNAFALRLQSLEAEIFISGIVAECAAKKIPVVSIHDGIRCKVTDSDAVAEIILRHWTARTGFSPRLKRGAEFLEPVAA